MEGNEKTNGAVAPSAEKLKALQLAIDYLIDTFEVTEIFTGVSLGNETAKHLYVSVGFETTGVVEDNMEEMKYVPHRHKTI